MKRKSLFGKVGVLALIVALLAGTTGVVYGMWSQTFNINVSSHTGTLSWNLTLGTPTTTGGGSIGDSANGNEIDISISGNPASTQGYMYSAPFSIQNTGSIPIKIQSVTFAGIPSGNIPAGVTATVTVTPSGLAIKGAQLDPGGILNGQISITDKVTGGVTFSTTILPVQWNQYVN